jgi:hypothetical protein
MLDLPIAANFARELTSDQFPEHHGARGRTTPPSRQELGAARAQAGASRHAAKAPGRRAGADPAGARLSGTLLGRALSRLVQARG